TLTSRFPVGTQRSSSCSRKRGRRTELPECAARRRIERTENTSEPSDQPGDPGKRLGPPGEQVSTDNEDAAPVVEGRAWFPGHVAPNIRPRGRRSQIARVGSDTPKQVAVKRSHAADNRAPRTFSIAPDVHAPPVGGDALVREPVVADR